MENKIVFNKVCKNPKVWGGLRIYSKKSEILL